MKINNSSFLQYLHLDNSYSLLNARCVKILLSVFDGLDIDNKKRLDDVQFYSLMRYLTDLSKLQIQTIFKKFDIDGSGTIEFEEFYLIVCIVIAVRDGKEKEFIYRHSRTVFGLLDEDGSESISADEFNNIGFLFNFQPVAIEEIFNEFDISGDQELDYNEFKLFSMECIDRQNEINRKAHDAIQQRKNFEKLKEKRAKIDFINKKMGYDYFKQNVEVGNEVENISSFYT